MEFAVIDLETTGLDKFGNDRIVEIAIVIADHKGVIRHSYSTLINPERDLGPTHIHKITGEMIKRAPTFSEVAASIALLLNGRVIVAHNANFDIRFLQKELNHAGYTLDITHFIDTLSLSRQLLTLSDYKLTTICEALNISLVSSHSAADDTQATYQVFVHLLHRYNLGIDSINPSFITPLPEWISFSNWTPRQNIAPASKPTIKDFVENLPVGDTAQDTDIPELVVQAYLELVHSYLINKTIREDATNNIKAYINGTQLSRGQVINLNEEYILLHICRILEDKQTWHPSYDAEIEHLTHILGLSSSTQKSLVIEIQKNSHIISPSAHTLRNLLTVNPHDHIAFTGEDFTYERSSWITYLQAQGFQASNSVLKTTRILVSNDLNSLSAKAVKGRSQSNTILFTEQTLIKHVGKPY